MSKYKILFQLSGSIAAFKACQVISQLVKQKYEVQVVCTPSTFEFIGKATLEGLTKKSVLSSSFEQGQAMAHIDLARWADLIVLCPATANTINSLASGTGAGLIGDLFLANNFQKPFWIVPAMNTQMYLHPATHESIKKLQGWGCRVMQTQNGSLACGEYGEGRMLEPEDLLKEISSYFDNLNKPKIKVLVTAGGTVEHIDGVRTISNSSTGETGKQIAEHLLSNNFEVYYVHSKSSLVPSFCKCHFAFKTADELEDLVKKLLAETEFDYVIHAAAVSDYKIDSIFANGEKIQANKNTKLSSDELQILLSTRPKIIDNLKKYSKTKKTKVIGFKLTSTDDKKLARDQVLKLSFNPSVDFVVHNRAQDIQPALGKHINEIFKGDKIIFNAQTKSGLAKNLLDLMRGNYDSVS